MKDKFDREVAHRNRNLAAPLYTDSVDVTSSNFGVKLSFGVVTACTERRIDVDSWVTVGMSKERAKVLHELLAEHLQ